MSEPEKHEQFGWQAALAFFSNVCGAVGGGAAVVTFLLWFAPAYSMLFWCAVGVTGSFTFLFMLGRAFKANNYPLESLGALLPDSSKQLREKPALDVPPRVAMLEKSRLGLPASTQIAQQPEPNIICSRARISYIREDSGSLVLVKAKSGDKGAMKAALVEFCNEPEPNRQTSYVNDVIARILYGDADSQIACRVNNGWWVDEDFNTTSLDVGNARDLVIAIQQDDGKFIAIDDRREGVNRHNSPEVTLLEQSQYDIAVRLIGGKRGEFVQEYHFQLTLEPHFSIKAQNPEGENAAARKPDKEILNVTPDELMDVYKEFTPTQAEHLAALNKGKWIRASGTIASKALYPKEVAILLSCHSGKMIQTHIPIRSAKDVEQLMDLPNGGAITILGQIQNVHRTAIFLDNCELVDS